MCMIQGSSGYGPPHYFHRRCGVEVGGVVVNDKVRCDIHITKPVTSLNVLNFIISIHAPPL